MSKQRIHKIKNDYGMPDYYKFYKEISNNPKSKAKYNEIITEYNTELQTLIIEENLIYQIPFLHLELILKKEKRVPRIKDGKLVNNLPINWKATNELWERDEEAKEMKLLIRVNNSHTSGFIFSVYCKKFKCTLKYRNLYKFKAVRNFSRKINLAIKHPDKDIDAFMLY